MLSSCNSERERGGGGMGWLPLSQQSHPNEKGFIGSTLPWCLWLADEPDRHYQLADAIPSPDPQLSMRKHQTNQKNKRYGL